MPSFARLSRFREVLRTSLGFAALGVGASVCGAAVVFLLLALQGIPRQEGDDLWGIGIAAAIFVGIALLIGTAWTAVLHRRTFVWFALGHPPTAEEARLALRMPVDVAIVSGTLWAIGTLTLGIFTWVLMSGEDAMGVALTIGLGGLTTVGLIYLLAEWVARPVLIRALAVLPRRGRLPTTVLTRLVLTWSMASGVPLLGILLVLLPPDFGSQDPRPTVLVLAGASLIVGALTTALLAKAVAAPLRRLRRALDEVARGRSDLRVPVDDTSEIGMLQNSVNDMVAGLREQDRMRDLFGRHVGADVARHALEHGASLSGDVREVTALFVDVVDSTQLAYRMPPQELVDQLNRLFACVVRAVSANGGLVNKFQGDAALCIFGAPTQLADPATSALLAARAIRDEVIALGELDLGVGISSGPVFAGQLGSSTRMEYTVIGDAVNEASRLTAHAKDVSGRILASGSVIDACADHERARWTDHEPLELRGRGTPTRTWQDRR